MLTFRLKSMLGLFLTATLVALGFRLFIVENYRISSDSMAPSLLAGDLVFVSKFDFNVRIPFSSYEIIKIRRPRYGEIVMFSLPDRGLETFVKRVVALEGDRVIIQNGQLKVNDQVVLHHNDQPGDMPDYGPVDIPKDHFFALGDNRRDSTDSRFWGPIPYSCLKGKVRMIWLSIAPHGSVRRERVGARVRS